MTQGFTMNTNKPSKKTNNRLVEISKILANGIYRLKANLSENQLDSNTHPSVHDQDINLKQEKGL